MISIIGFENERAFDAPERVSVHRCGCGECAPVVCCSAEVGDVGGIDKATALVRFAAALRVEAGPLCVPVKGQNFYVA